jgi:hypothetical protein
MGLADERAMDTRIDVSETFEHFINLDDYESRQGIKIICETWIKLYFFHFLELTQILKNVILTGRVFDETNVLIAET